MSFRSQEMFILIVRSIPATPGSFVSLRMTSYWVGTRRAPLQKSCSSCQNTLSVPIQKYWPATRSGDFRTK